MGPPRLLRADSTAFSIPEKRTLNTGMKDTPTT
jgi:hypothetical protein